MVDRDRNRYSKSQNIEIQETHPCTKFVEETAPWMSLTKLLIFLSLGVVKFAKIFSQLPIFNDCGASFSVGMTIYWVANFGQWAGWIYWWSN